MVILMLIFTALTYFSAIVRAELNFQSSANSSLEGVSFFFRIKSCLDKQGVPSIAIFCLAIRLYLRIVRYFECTVWSFSQIDDVLYCLRRVCTIGILGKIIAALKSLIVRCPISGCSGRYAIMAAHVDAVYY